MSDPSNVDRRTGAPALVAGTLDAIRNAWETVKTVYWANSVSWRVLKAGGLLFFGFFLWAGSNVLYAYTELWLLRYTMAYGILLLWYGPAHHLVVIPLALRWRRSSGTRQSVGKRLPTAMLSVFLVGVLLLGTFPVGPTTMDFGSGLAPGSEADVHPELTCTKTTTGEETTIHCRIDRAEAVDRVVVTSGGSQLLVDEDPPYEFTVDASEVETTVGHQQFRVELYDEDGDLLRRYTRRVATIDRAPVD